ncbi:MAG TPA: amino acid adenylation domain-containing protein, partial [Thermoanaerobaculia bacterium]|nr:amino acid adenylation domain-containing protein [Thermoanaerobaculia bacterium]
SFAQERLWFLDQLGEGGAAYNIPAAVLLLGRLSVPALAAALDEVVRRHEALRTTFEVNEESRVVQVIGPSLILPLPVIDLSAVPKEAERLAAREAARSFDLGRGPLLRARLVRIGETEHRLLLVMHHIIADGWSMGVLLRELARLYDGAGLPALPVQYGDYAVWQRGWLRGEALDRQLGFWKPRLAGLPPLLELPSDRPRPAVLSTRGGVEERAQDSRLGASLDRLSRGATLFMALLAGLQVLLGRLTGREDPPVGAPIANRHRAETEGIVGLFVNTLALPADLSGDPTFADLLARVREATLDAYAHQDLPFEKLVEELRLERDLSHAQVFQVLLVVQNAPPAPRSMSGLSLTPVPVETGTAKLDLTLGVVDRPEGRLLQAEYSRDLFDRTTIARWLGGLAGLLEAAAANPSLRLSELPLLSSEERHQGLFEWNDTAAAHPVGSCLHELVAAQAARTPEAVAVVCQDERISYRELLCRSRRIAHRLQALGVNAERPVGVCLERTPDLVAALLGILQAGGVYVPLDPTYPAERLAFLLEDCGFGFEAPLVVTREPLLARLGRPVQSICLDRDAAALAAESDDDPEAAVGPENLAYLIYTSGSTGRPKGVAISHRNTAALIHWATEVFPPEDLSGVLASTSINFDLSVFELFVPLSRGGTVILADNALSLAGLPEAAEVTLINTVPSAMAELLRLEALPPGLRTVNLAGEPLSQGLVAEIEKQRDVRVFDLYGPSEDTTYSTFIRRRGSEPATVGRPLVGGQTYVLDRWEQPAPVGVAGEIWLGGAGLARGYFHRPELTAERFVPDPFSPEPGQRLYRTGDLARFRTDGCLDLLGRIDQQVKIRGFRIELGEVEANLLAHPDLIEAAVLATGEGGDRKLVAWVVGNAGEDLRSFLSGRLPSHMVPSVIGVLEALPRLPNGKVDRRALAALALPGQENREGYVEPESEDERRIAAAWAEVLVLPRVGLHDDFFKLGGHSLLATRIVARLRRDFDVELPLRILFQAPTVARLAAAVREAQAAATVPAIPRIAAVSRSASQLRARSTLGRRDLS